MSGACLRPDPQALGGLVATLATEVGRDFDLVLAITRGGLVPAGMLADRLDLREMLVTGLTAAPCRNPTGTGRTARSHEPLTGDRLHEQRWSRAGRSTAPVP